MKNTISGFFSGLLYFLAGLWIVERLDFGNITIPDWGLALAMALFFIGTKYFLDKA